MIAKTHPAASVSSFNPKQLSSNTRIIAPSEAGVAGNGRGVVLKLKKVTMASVPRSKFAPLVIKTHRSGLFLLGARLTQHGGEVAVEIARKLARKAELRLVVLGTNVIAISLVDAASIPPGSPVDSSPNIGAKDGWYSHIEHYIERLGQITNDFHSQINALLA